MATGGREPTPRQCRRDRRQASAPARAVLAARTTSGRSARRSPAGRPSASRSSWRSWSARSDHPRLERRSRPGSFDWTLPFAAYAALLEGSLGIARRPSLNTLAPGDAADPRRPGGRARLQGRPVQHRRPGQFLHAARSAAGGRRRAGDAPPLDRDPGRALAGCSPARRGASSPAPSRLVGCPRGRHHDHAQLHRRRS